MSEKKGRNDPCHCGSGKKYKNCCLQKDSSKGTSSLSQRKFTAKVISAGGLKKAENETNQADAVTNEYTTLLKRSFGEVINDESEEFIPLSKEKKHETAEK